MKRGVCITIIVVFLALVCVLEQILVSVTLDNLEQKTQALIKVVYEYENINNNDILIKTNELNSFWEEHENLLCFFINHKDMQEMGTELKKMQTYIETNNSDEYLTSLNLVIYYTDTFNHIMGLSLQNLI